MGVMIASVACVRGFLSMGLAIQALIVSGLRRLENTITAGVESKSITRSSLTVPEIPLRRTYSLRNETKQVSVGVW